MVNNQAFTSEPRRVSKPRKARRNASCTISSASMGERHSQRAKRYAASRCGNTCASNRLRLSSMDETSAAHEAKTHGRRILFPPGAQAGGIDRVREQHRDGHGAQSTGNGRDPAGAGRGRGKLDITDQRTAGGAVDADVEHRGSGANPLSGDET